MRIFKAGLILFACLGEIPLSASMSQGPITPGGFSPNVFQNPGIMRREGLTEPIGSLLMMTQSSGTILDGSYIDFTFTFGATITDSPGIESVQCNSGACPPSVSTSIVSPSTFRISFVDADNDPLTGTVVVASGSNPNFIQISRMRIDATNSPSLEVRVQVSSFSPDTINHPVGGGGLFQIGYIGPIFVPSLPTQVPSQGTSPVTILKCSPPVVSGDANVTLTAVESMVRTLATSADEALFASSPAPTSGTGVEISFIGAPPGMMITPLPLTGQTSVVLPSALTQTDPNNHMVFIYPVTATNIYEAETIQFRFNIGTSGGAPLLYPPSTIVANITAKVRLLPISSSGILRFVDNLQGTGLVAQVADCRPPGRAQTTGE
jgi:hypothetical protein